jgi:parallel beta-helix repeat protein
MLGLFMVLAGVAIGGMAAMNGRDGGIQFQAAARLGMSGFPTISINGNSEITDYTSIGDGSAGSPYIIQGYALTGNETVNAISISGVTDYLVVLNCNATTGNSTSTYGIYLSNCVNVAVINCSMYSCFDGLDLAGTSTNITISGNTIVYNEASGIYTSGTIGSNTITQNNCSNNGEYGIYLDEANDSVTNNTCDANSNCGIDGYYGDIATNIITQNNCSYDNGEGIFLYEANDSLSDNTCDWNEYGIDCEYEHVATNTITQNHCSHDDDGIYLEEANDSVSDNTCCFNELGIDSGYFNVGANTITQNQCSNNTYSGIYLEEANDSVSDNTCCYNWLYGIDSEYGDIATNTFTQNHCINNTEYGIYLAEMNDSVSDNTFLYNGNGMQFYEASNNTVNGNNCSRNLLYGLVLTDNSNSNFFTGNWFMENGLNSVILNCTSANENQNNTFSQDHGIITANATAILVGGTIQFSELITNQSSMSFQWDFKDGSANVTSANPTHVFNTAGTFTATVFITDANGSRFYETITITVSAAQSSGTHPATPFGDSGIIALATLLGIAGVVVSIESKPKRSCSP